MSFSPVQASFEGFRFIRERPQSVTLWMTALLGLNLAATAFGLSPWALRLQQLKVTTDFDWSWETVQVFAFHLLPAAFVALALMLAGLCIVAPSILRVMLHPDAAPRFRLGPDEGRMLWLYLAMVLIVFVAAIPSGIVLGYSLSLAQPVADALGSGWLLVLLGQFASLLMMLFIVIRLSLAAPIAIDQGRLDLMEAWRMTRGVFWRLLGGALLGMLLVLVVSGIALVGFYLASIMIVFVLGISPDSFSAFLWPQGEGMLDHFGLGPLLRAVFESALLALLFCVLCGEVVYAYRELSSVRAATGPEDGEASSAVG
jgi:hypothetical protein